MAALPEQQARQTIDAMLVAAGWAVQDYKAFDPSASVGIALREVPLKSGSCDYLLPVNRKPLGLVEAKNKGIRLSQIAEQTRIVAEVERRLSVVTTNLQRATRLRQSILQRAFEGKL